VRGRTLELEGEAVFTVAHESTRPFAVRTSRAVATDLGTCFVVRAYLDDPNTDVVVAEGQVAVTAGGQADGRTGGHSTGSGEECVCGESLAWWSSVSWA
jgi:ferric-dicitrate binding protein FerR (iron transport regulator)